MERLFSYGTLQSPNVQLATFRRFLDGQPDALMGFKRELVEITDPEVLASSGERFHPIVVRSGDSADRVAGTVFEITEAELAAADAYEVSDYERVSAPLASGSTAWVYVKRA
ncbi:MAG: gamma-glutamylcyclotransferase [Alphaproteobacteria bacterium]|nr:gamma-glutamylcyclotransferase [Alphaproteobacteria bacterium]